MNDNDRKLFDKVTEGVGYPFHLGDKELQTINDWKMSVTEREYQIMVHEAFDETADIHSPYFLSIT